VVGPEVLASIRQVGKEVAQRPVLGWLLAPISGLEEELS
jgi:hypothetical protein